MNILAIEDREEDLGIGGGGGDVWERVGVRQGWSA
jgi:hypothetical protein